jgi:hypothetical protein
MVLERAGDLLWVGELVLSVGECIALSFLR